MDRQILILKAAKSWPKKPCLRDGLRNVSGFQFSMTWIHWILRIFLEIPQEFCHGQILKDAEEDIVDTATLRDPKPVGVLRVTAPWQVV